MSSFQSWEVTESVTVPCDSANAWNGRSPCHGGTVHGTVQEL